MLANLSNPVCGLCTQPTPQALVPKPVQAKPPGHQAQRKSEWMKNASVRTGPSLRQVI